MVKPSYSSSRPLNKTVPFCGPQIFGKDQICSTPRMLSEICKVNVFSRNFRCVKLQKSLMPNFCKFLSSDFIQYSWIIIWRYISMLYHATLHRNPHIIFTNYLGSFALFSVFNRTFLRVIDHFSGQEDQTFCRQWVPKKLHCWESSENQNHFLTQQTDACFHQTRVMVIPTVYILGQ